MAPRRAARLAGLLLLAVGLTGLLFHLRALTPPSGDSAEISGFVERDTPIWYLRWPLTHLLAQAIHHGTGLSGADSLALLSASAGALFLLTVGAISRRSPLILIVLLSSVTLTLIGHVEVYAWPFLILLWLLLLGPRHLRGEISLTPLVSLFALGCLMHMLLVFYAPALVHLAVAGRRRALARGETREALDADAMRALLCVILLFAVLAVMPLLLQPGGLDNDFERLVPLTAPEVPRSSNQVTLLSSAHLWAVAWFLLISCPVGMTLVLLRLRRAWSSDTLRFTCLAALCGLVFLILWHPDMGWRWDWDLFSHPGLVINVLAWRLWTQCQSRRRPRRDAHPQMGPDSHR